MLSIIKDDGVPFNKKIRRAKTIGIEVGGVFGCLDSCKEGRKGSQ